MDEMKKLYEEGGMQAVRDAWIQTRLEQEFKGLHEIDRDEAVDQILDAIPRNVSNGWFREANSEYKPTLVEDILSNPGTLNAGLNVAYDGYLSKYGRKSVITGEWIPNEGVTEKPMSFNKWLKTPQTMYRGTHGQKTIASDEFISYTTDLKVANKFGNNISSIKIRPIDTLGSYQTTAEFEYLVLASRFRK